MDADNLIAGYPTQLQEYALKWFQAWQLGLAATVLYWVFFAVCFVMVFIFPQISGYLMLVIMPVGFACWLAAVSLVSDSDQIDPKSYQYSYFKSCTVSVVAGSGYGLAGFSVVCGGVVAVIIWVMAIIFWFCWCSQECCHHKDENRSMQSFANNTPAAVISYHISGKHAV